jgi:hypothetical protein
MHKQLQAIITVLSLINPAICAAMFARAVAGQSLHLVAFLGCPDHSVRPCCHVLHDARTGARDWEGKGAEDILRTDAAAGILNENESKEKVCLTSR